MTSPGTKSSYLHPPQSLDPSYREKCLMRCPSNQVIKSYSEKFSSSRRLHEDKLCDTLQAMTSSNVKTVYQTSLLHIESNLDRLRLLSPTHGQRSQQQRGHITLQSVLLNKPEFLKATYHTEIRKNEIPTSMLMEAFSWGSRRASQYPAVQSPAHP